MHLRFLFGNGSCKDKHHELGFLINLLFFSPMKAVTNSLEGCGKQVAASRRHSVTGCTTGGTSLGPCVRRHSVSGCRLLSYPKASVLEETPFAKRFPALAKFIPHGASYLISVIQY